MGDWISFWVMAPISVLSAAAMVLARNAVHAALLLVVNFFTLAVFFLILGSPFLFVVQIIVYAGAIMVLFLFVIMLLGVDRSVPLTERIKAQPWIAVLLGIGLVAEVALAVRAGLGFSREILPDFAAANRGGNVRALAQVLFNRYFFPFEVTSVLLIVAAMGAMLHGRRPLREGPLDARSQARLGPETAGPETATVGGAGPQARTAGTGRGSRREAMGNPAPQQPAVPEGLP